MNLASYTEADHDRALQRLADDIDAAMPDPAWMPPDPPGTVDLDAPLLRDNHGEPVDLGEPWALGDVVLLFAIVAAACAVFVWAMGGVG